MTDETEKLRKMCRELIDSGSFHAEHRMVHIARALLSRLDAPTDADIAEIEKRHEFHTHTPGGNNYTLQKLHQDRATLLRKLRATQAELRAALVSLPAAAAAHLKEVEELRTRVRVAECRIYDLAEPFVDDRGVSWRAPTAEAYQKACAALDNWKARAVGAEKERDTLKAHLATAR